LEYLYYDSQHKQIQAILTRLLGQIASLSESYNESAFQNIEASDAMEQHAMLHEAIISEAGQLNNAVQELLSTFSDLPAILPTAANAPNGSDPPTPREAWASTQQLEAILNNMIAGVVVYDAEGVIKFANGYAIALFGFDPTRMWRDSLSRRLEVYGEDGKRILVHQMPSSIAAGGEVVMNRPLTIHGALGRAAHVLCSAMPVMAGERLTGVVSVWNDVTGQHNLLKENEHQRELLEAIFNAISDSVTVYDTTGQPIRANLATVQNLGFDPTQGERPEAALRLAIHHPDGTRVALEELTSSLALSGVEIRDVPYRFTDMHGQTHAIRAAGAPLRNEQGEINGAVTIWHDVTELEQLRKQAEDERDRLKAILSSMNDEVWYCDLEGNVTLMNDVAGSRLSSPDSEERNRPLAGVLHDPSESDDTGAARPDEPAPLLRSLKGETIRGEEITRNQHTGERVFREYIASPILSKADQITGAVAVVRDISRQKQQEADLLRANQALRESQRTLEKTVAALRKSIANERARFSELNAIMDAVPAIIFITRDPASREVTGNRVANEFLRVRPRVNLSKSAPETEAETLRNFQVFQNGRELRPEELPLQLAAASGLPVRDFEEDVIFDDGTHAHLIGNVTPLQDEAGRPAGAVAAFLDITERIEHDTYLEVQRRLLEHREMERQKIARDLHDGPVQGLSGLVFSLKMLLDRSSDPEIREMLIQMQEDLRQQAQELREVINELRPPALARFGLRSAIRSFADDFQTRHPGLEMQLELTENTLALPDTAVLALYRIFQEALHNIERHTQASQVVVRLSIDPLEGSVTRNITLEIEDNGVGFRPTGDWVELARQGHFGLLGMKERAEAIGGQLIIQSQPGKGTRIIVIIPWEG
jgi:PAS domain S-box-containing protein